VILIHNGKIDHAAYATGVCVTMHELDSSLAGGRLRRPGGNRGSRVGQTRADFSVLPFHGTMRRTEQT